MIGVGAQFLSRVGHTPQLSAGLIRPLVWAAVMVDPTEILAYLCKIYHIDAYSFLPKTYNFPENVLS